MQPKKTPQEESNDAANAFSRTIAAGLLMLAFMAGGYYLDKWLGTNFLIIVGVIVGMTLSITVMLIHTKLSEYEQSVKHVKPLPPDPEPEEDQRDQQKS